MNDELRDAPVSSHPTRSGSPIGELEDNGRGHGQPDANDPAGIGSVVSTFVDHIDSLRSTLKTSMLMAAAGHRTVVDEFRSYAKNYGTDFEENDDGFKASFSHSNARHADRLARRVKRARDGLELVPRSFVVALVSEFDAFLGRLLKAVFLRRPTLLSASDRTLGVSELLEFDTLEAAKEFLLEKEVETVIRKSHSDQFNWLEQRFDLPLRKNLEAWRIFIELTERRNLFVHNDGVVSRQYLTICQQHNVEVSEDAVLGRCLAVSPEYFEQAHACIYEIGVKLSQVLWRKLLPRDLKSAEGDLTIHTYDLLVRRRNALAATLLDFARQTLKKHTSDQTRRIFVMNRAQAYKWLDKQEVCDTIIGAEDWSACGEQFQLCVHVLRGELKEACEIMRRIGSEGSVTEADYEDWPMFQEFRNSDEFAATFKEVFGKEFANIEKKLKVEQQERMREIEERMQRVWGDEETDADGES